jgi:hypothetical protein
VCCKCFFSLFVFVFDVFSYCLQRWRAFFFFLNFLFLFSLLQNSTTKEKCSAVLLLFIWLFSSFCVCFCRIDVSVLLPFSSYVLLGAMARVWCGSDTCEHHINPRHKARLRDTLRNGGGRPIHNLATAFCFLFVCLRVFATQAEMSSCREGSHWLSSGGGQDTCSLYFFQERRSFKQSVER